MGMDQKIRTLAASTLLCSVLALCACSANAPAEGSEDTSLAGESSAAVQSAESGALSALEGVPTEADIPIEQTYADDSDGGHVLEADGTQDSYSNAAVEKTGDSQSGDEADFYGDNAAVFATNGATLDLSQLLITTDGTHANAVFSYGEGTTVNVADSVIETSGNCSGGLMTTGGGTMNAANLNISTTGNSSAAIRSDRGGGTVNVAGGSYTTSGTGSPVIYSTADITVSDAVLTSAASQGVVVEGKNSVTLHDVDLTADNNTKNSDKSDTYQAVMIYQSMSGDADQGASSFAMDGGSLTNLNGDIFFVNNTVTAISLEDVDVKNKDQDGVFLRAEAAGWGTEGSNGGQVELTAADQVIEGDMLVDDVSKLNLYLGQGSSFTGSINPDGAAGDVYAEITDGSTWTLTADSYISSLTCAADSIDLNGHTLYVDGKAYEAGKASTGEEIEFEVASSTGGSNAGEPGEGGPGDGSAPPEKPGNGQGGPGESGDDAQGIGGTPPEKPSGAGKGGPGNGGTPPEKPSSN